LKLLILGGYTPAASQSCPAWVVNSGNLISYIQAVSGENNIRIYKSVVDAAFVTSTNGTQVSFMIFLK